MMLAYKEETLVIGVGFPTCHISCPPSAELPAGTREHTHRSCKTNLGVTLAKTNNCKYIVKTR